MSTYKVIQDIEAEDKLVGPLSMRQFIYAGIAAICGYLTFLSVTKHAAFMAVIFLPVMAFTGFFAFPWAKDQPTEIWALAKIRFFLKPRKRIWDQSGAKELVSITVPKRIERHLTNGLNQHEVNSRLRALADTIDSRGWAVKNVNVNMYNQASANSDRLVEASALPQEVSGIDVRPSDDILDENANPVAHHFDDMIAASSTARRQHLVAQMESPAELQQPVQAQAAATQASQQPQQAANDYWFMQQQPSQIPEGQAIFSNSPIIAPGAVSTTGVPMPHAAIPTADEEALVEKFKAENNSLAITQGHMKVVKTPQQQEAEAAARTQVEAALKKQAAQKAPVTPVEQAAIMNLSRNNDLDVATIARQLHKPTHVDKGTDPNEVVISLR